MKIRILLWSLINLLGNLLFKHKLQNGEHISSASLNGGGGIACYYEERGFAYINSLSCFIHENLEK